MQAILNQEGLSFKEWVCAAGVALYMKNKVLSDRRWYTKTIYQAWLDGVDPSEYRFHI